MCVCVANEERREAEAYLENLKEQDYGQYMLGLCSELVAGPEEVAREMAGLNLKLLLDAQDPVTKMKHAQRWRGLAEETRMTIKNGLFDTLGSPDWSAGKTAAIVSAKIAAIELPEGAWPGLIAALLENMTRTDANLQRATLTCLGYICEGVSPDVLAEESDDILTAIISGMEDTVTDDTIRLAATRALNNALEFITGPFEEEQDRNYIMTVVCSATQSENVQIRRSAMEFLVKIASFFYHLLAPYMEVVYQLTFEAIRTDPRPSALQAIEFWSSICEEEILLNADEKKMRARNERPEQVSANYVLSILGELVELLTSTMCRQEEDQQPSTWNISMAAGTCLNLVAKAVGDPVIEEAMKFIGANIEGETWREVEASLFAFGSILEGVTSAAIAPLISSGLPTFAPLMSSDVLLIAESASWTIGCICKYHADAIDSAHGSALLQAINEGMSGPPRVAASCCWALNNLAESYADPESSTYALSPFYNDLMGTLLAVSVRDDAFEGNLRVAAYTTISMMVETSADDCIEDVSSAFMILMERLRETLMTKVATEDEDRARSDLQALICSTLQSVIERVEEGITPHAEALMELFMGVFNCNETSIHEEALIACGALIRAIDEEFANYMEMFFPVLTTAIANYHEASTCRVAIGIAGDCCRALDDGMVHFADDLVSLVLANLNSDDLPDSVKPVTLSLFGDIALAIESNYEPYVQATMGLLCQASEVTVDTRYPALVDYANELRYNVLEGFTGIIQGLREGKKEQLIQENVNYLFQFLGFLYKDEFRNLEVTRAAVACIGDLAHTFGTYVSNYLKAPFVAQFIRELGKASDPDSADVYNHARSNHRRYKDK